MQDNWIFNNPETDLLHCIHLRANPFLALVVTAVKPAGNNGNVNCKDIYQMSLRTIEKVVRERGSFKCYDDQNAAIPITIITANQKERKINIRFDEGTKAFPCNSNSSVLTTI